MKKVKAEPEDELRAKCDETLLHGGVRGKYAERWQADTHLVRLDPDVAAAFPDGRAVNEALRKVIRSAVEA